MSEFSEEGFRAYCEANGLLQRDLSRGAVNERIPASEETEARESYYDYMKRRSREEDDKMRLKSIKAEDILNGDTIDSISKDVLEWHRNTIAENLADYFYRQKHMHSDDIAHYSDLLPKFNAVCNYFGIEERRIDYYMRSRLPNV